MNKNKYISLIIFTLFFTTIIFGFAVSNVFGAITFSTGFEDGTLLTNYDNGNIVTFHNDPANFGVSNLYVYGGAKSFYMSDADHSGWINLSRVDEDNILQKLEFWIYMDNGVFNMYGYSSQEDVAANDYSIWVKNAGASWQYEDINSVNNAFASTEGDVWHYMEIEFSANDTVIYTYNNESEIGTPAKVMDGGIKYLRFINNDNNDDIGVDNFRYEVGNSYTGGGGGGDVFEGYKSFCSNYGGKPLSTYLTFGNPEINIYSGLKGNLRGFEFFFDKQQYDNYPTLTNYECWLNGEYVGSPTEWVPVDTTTYKLRWDGFTIPLDYDELLAEIHHVEDIYYTKINNKPLGMTIGASHYSKTYDLMGNGIIDGIELEPTSKTWTACFYWEDAWVEPDCTGNDKITINGDTFYTGDTVLITYDLSTKTTTTTLNISLVGKGATGMVQGYPQTLTECDDTLGYVPVVAGTHTIYIWREGVGNVSYKNITVLNNPNKNMMVFTIPNPSEIFDDITVYLNYTHPSDYDGGLFVSETSNPNDGELWLVFESGVENATYTYDEIDETRNYYFILCSKNPSGNYMIVPEGVHTHYVKGINTQPAINVAYEYINLKNGVATQYYSYTNSHVGQDVKIFDNSNFISNVGNNAYGEQQPFEVSTLGTHNLTMILKDCCGGDDTVLAYDIFYVSPEEEPEEPLLPELDEKVGALIGIILTIVLTLLPILIQVGFKVDIEVPALVYGAFGCFGIILSIYLGFFDIWVIVFIIAVLLLFSVIQFFQNR